MNKILFLNRKEKVFTFLSTPLPPFKGGRLEEGASPLTPYLKYV